MSAAVTVLMPVRDYQLDYLEEAIGSIVGQTSADWRLLIIVNSEDRAEFVARAGRLLGDPRIKVIENEGRKLAGKLNTGMRHASTPFVSVLFADDLWEPSAIAVLSRNIERYPEADLFHSSRRFVDDDGNPTGKIWLTSPGVTAEDFVEGTPVKHLLCWRREVGLAIGGIDESLNSIGADDVDFPWRMAEHGARFEAVPECLYVARDHRRCFRLTTHVPRSVHERELRRILRKHGVGREMIKRRLERARTSYLQQCIYANSLDRWVKQRFTADSWESWREPFD